MPRKSSMDANGPDIETILRQIMGCLEAALSSIGAAKACRTHLESLPDGDEIGPAMAKTFRSWGLSKKQTRVLRGWPPLQLGLLRAALVVVARSREDGLSVNVRVRGVVGYPPALSITLTTPADLELIFTWPEMV
jgi:hypothetical protein